jgi:hypothetical protein
MLINTEAYDAVDIAGFNILYHDGHIIVTQANSYKYLIENEIIFQHRGDKFQKNNLLKVLLLLDNLPKELFQAISDRTGTLLGVELFLYTDVKKPMHFCKDKDFAIHYGINDPILVKLTISDTFDNEKDFDKSFTNNNDEAFGFWDMKKNEISPSYVWCHPSQTKICFSDFAKYDISIGSLFLKLKIDRV